MSRKEMITCDLCGREVHTPEYQVALRYIWHKSAEKEPPVYDVTHDVCSECVLAYPYVRSMPKEPESVKTFLRERFSFFAKRSGT